MTRKYISAAALALFGCGAASAQDIYKVEALSSTDLSGDARYVGMGGAMNALGANLSAMSSTPASAGLYRRSDISLTAGCINSAYDNVIQVGPSKTRASFDQMGFVYSCNLGNSTKMRFFNMGFNYKKGRNFKSYIGLNDIATPKFLDAAGVPLGMSQSWQFADLAIDLNDRYLDLGNEKDSENTTPSTLLAYDTWTIDAVDANGESVGDRDVKIAGYVPSYANRYNYHRAQWGGVEDYDFNLSFNVNERVYLGANIGLHSVNYHSALLYEEELYQNGNVHDTGLYTFYTDESLTGMGVDGKFGILVRPIEESPFRIGLTYTTPTAFDLESRSYGSIESPYEDVKGNSTSFADVDLTNSYRIRTPWKLDVNAATTIGNYFALDAEYQLTGYSSAAVRYEDNGGHFAYHGFKTDKYLQEEINAYLRNVHTFRLGLEGRLSDEFSLRAGYNYVSSPFDNKAYLNLLLDGSSYYYALNTDYVNLGPTHRFTIGMGYHYKAFYLDAAYLFQTQAADVYAFHYNDTDRWSGVNDLPAQSYHLNRSQLFVTMGFKF